MKVPLVKVQPGQMEEPLFHSLGKPLVAKKLGLSIGQSAVRKGVPRFKTAQMVALPLHLLDPSTNLVHGKPKPFLKSKESMCVFVDRRVSSPGSWEALKLGEGKERADPCQVGV